MQTGGRTTIDTLDIKGASGAGAVYEDVTAVNLDGSAPQNTFLGQVQVDASVPNADGDLSEFGVVFPAAPATQFDKVDELGADDDATYIQSDAPAQKSTWQGTTLPAIVGGGSVLAVQINTKVKKLSSRNKSFRDIVRIGGTNFFGSPVGLSLDYVNHHTIQESNPQTAAAWTTAEIDALQTGVE